MAEVGTCHPPTHSSETIIDVKTSLVIQLAFWRYFSWRKAARVTPHNATLVSVTPLVWSAARQYLLIELPQFGPIDLDAS